jgi:hypothetical protein
MDMKIPLTIIAVLLSALLTVEAWTLNTVIQLKADVAVLNALANNKPNK